MYIDIDINHARKKNGINNLLRIMYNSLRTSSDHYKNIFVVRVAKPSVLDLQKRIKNFYLKSILHAYYVLYVFFQDACYNFVTHIKDLPILAETSFHWLLHILMSTRDAFNLAQAR